MNSFQFPPEIEIYLTPRAEALGVKEPSPKDGDCCYDLPTMIDFTVDPGKYVMVPTGLIFVLPSLEPPLRIASNVTARTSIGQMGLIPVARIFDPSFLMKLEDDPEQYGWTLCLRNISDETITKKVGDRIAQLHLIVTWRPTPRRITAEALSAKRPTERGAKGFGGRTGV